MRRMLWVAVGLVVVFFGIGLVLRLLENRFTFFPTDLEEGALARYVADLPPNTAAWREVSFPTEDGETVTGWLGVPREPRAWLLWFHGNGGSVEYRWADFSRFVTEERLAVLIVDYRGYGRSTGSPDEEGVYRDAKAARRFFLAEGADPERLFILGRSLGGAVATAEASREPPRGLIIESTFTSYKEIVADVIPVYPAHWFAKSRYPTADRLAKMDIPVLILHGTADELIPFEHGERLAKLLKDPLSRFVPVEGADHNGVTATLGRAYFDTVTGFIDAVLAK